MARRGSGSVRQDGRHELADSVVLVTGGASGLGEAIVRRAVAQGAAGVGILDVSEEKATALALELGPKAVAVPADLTVPGQVSEAIAATIAEFGRIDVLVSCAGIPWAQRTVDREGNPANLDAFRKVIEVNLIGTFDVVAKTAASMSRNEPNDDGERGVIVITASVAAIDGQIGQAAYSASKGGIVGHDAAARPRPRRSRHPRRDDRARPHRHPDLRLRAAGAQGGPGQDGRLPAPARLRATSSRSSRSPSSRTPT